MTPQIIRSGAGDAQNILGMRHLNKIRPGGPVPGLLVEVTAPPGLGAPPHRHDDDTEVFYLLEGELTILSEDERHVLRPGDTCILPARGEHAFCNESGAPVRFLAFISPGLDAIDFFTAVDAAGAHGEASPETIMRIGSDRGVVFAEPA